MNEEGAKRDARKPWDPQPIGQALTTWEGYREEYENKMMQIGLGDFVIDEIALMFSHRISMMEFVLDAVMEKGVELVNRAYDQVSTHPFHTEYDVEYLFLQMPSTMRVECMAITSGCSPVHEAVASHMRDDAPLIVHLSFKVPDLNGYEKVCEVLDTAPRITHVQSCSSTYGAFAYYHVQNEDSLQFYLKPRVNLRDIYMDRGEFGMPGLGLGQNVLPFEEWDK